LIREHLERLCLAGLACSLHLGDLASFKGLMKLDLVLGIELSTGRPVELICERQRAI